MRREFESDVSAKLFALDVGDFRETIKAAQIGVAAEHTAVIAHIERKAAAVLAKADVGGVDRGFADAVARVLGALVDDLNADLHILDRETVDGDD
jgi:hypothetical protein